MSAPITPYTTDLDGRDPLEAIRDTIDRVGTLARGRTADWFERSYAPGKWSARQVLTHLAQTELALGTRARMALATPHYASQNFDQDSWMAIESGSSGQVALEAFLAAARMNLVFFEGLSAAQRATGFTHPEYGALTVDWIIHQMAGHHIHHRLQLERIT